MGALLMEEIEPGTPLQDSGTYPALSDVAQLLTALHTPGTPDRAFPSVADRGAYLFAAWARERQHDPTQLALAADPTLAPWPGPADQAVCQTGAWLLPDESLEQLKAVTAG